MDADAAQSFRLSRYASVATVERGWLIANGMYLERVLLDEAFAPLCRLLESQSVQLEDIRRACPQDADPLNLLMFLRRHHLLVPEDADEPQALRDRIAELERTAFPDPGGAEPRWPPSTRYDHPERLPTETFAVARRHTPLRVALVGGCMLQFLQQSLIKIGLEHGFDISLRHDWPPLSSSSEAALRDWCPDLAVLQLTVHPFMTALWDGGAFCAASARERRVDALEDLLSSSIEQLCRVLDGRLGLIHNFAPPAISPFGRLEFRAPVNFRRIVFELNSHIDTAVAQHANLMVLDEERLAAMHGAEALFDDATLPFGHHGGALDPHSAELDPYPYLSNVLANEYLHCYELHHRVRSVKCVVVDLDDTLWPGVAAEDGFGWLDGDGTQRWLSLGLNQALQLLKDRGILLAVCSKGSREETLAAWNRARHPLLLRPEDFVALRINWLAKSQNIAELSGALGVAPDQMIFLDDNPVERREVSRRLPTLRVPDLPAHRFRHYLLTASSCEVPTVTPEARARTDTTKAMLKRVPPESNLDMPRFLRSLRIKVVVRRAGLADLTRATELLNRTNQFATSTMRLSESEMAARIARPSICVTTMTVEDRFAAYGLVGVCLIERGVVTALCVSCRVIGLDVGLPFLVASLRDPDLPSRQAAAHLERTTRNAPAHDVFLRAGFREVSPDRYKLVDVDRLPQLSDFPQHITAALGQQASREAVGAHRT